MKQQIRRNVFETNSSSVHSITMCSLEDYKKWENGELVYDKLTKEIRKPFGDSKWEMTWEDFDEKYGENYETFEKTFNTKNGDTVVAFGYYGDNY